MESILLTALLACVGTEPFWSLNISPEQISLSTYPDARRLIEPVKPQPFAGMSDWYAKTYQTQFQDNKEPVTIVVKQNTACSDGMSESRYEYEVFIVSPNGPNYYGCCNKKAE